MAKTDNTSGYGEAVTFTKQCLKFLNKAHSAVRGHFGATSDLPTFLETLPDLSLRDRILLVEQALVLLEENYVHRPFKEAMHGVDPLQRLRLLKHRLDQATEATMGSQYRFHREMLEIFNSVRDLHTSYELPAPFTDKVAFLPFAVEEYFDEAGSAHYMATHLMEGFYHRHFKAGVEITMWNGVPIARAIEVHAEQHAGSNVAARHVRGLDGLTIRALKRTLPPDAHWVDVGYIDLEGEPHEMRQDWLVAPVMRTGEGEQTAAALANASVLGLDREAELVGSTKKMLFAPAVVGEENKATLTLTDEKAAPGEETPTAMPGLFRAKCVETAAGVFGYVRIFSFNIAEETQPNEFVEEFIRLIALLPQEGLIVDVRGNGGGNIMAGEGLLQLLTPRTIVPEPAQFINTPLNLRVCARHNAETATVDLEPWVKSIRDAVQTGATYSRGFPITSPDFANQWGQRYHGPVVLVTDARCYSATDIFAAGFQDHEIGKILGVHENTGAGGANVLSHSWLSYLMQVPEPADPQIPYQRLPGGANLSVSWRRTLRVGAQAGTPLEDLGVQPDELHAMTRDDLLHGNRDLVEHAGRLLAAMPVRRLDVVVEREGSIVTITPQTIRGLSRLDVYVDGRPLASYEWGDDPPVIEVGIPHAGQTLELAAYERHELAETVVEPDDGEEEKAEKEWTLVAARKFPLPAGSR